MRKYTQTVRTPWGEETRPVSGLVLVHLFNKVWKVGRAKIVDGKNHCVIYSPEDKEYHVWGEDVDNFYTPKYEDYYERSRNRPDPAKVKIYILTTILDDRKNWCFDMSAKPSKENVKVIFENGKIAWVSFDGEWKNSYEKLVHNSLKINEKGEVYSDKNSTYTEYKKIVAWRIK